MCVEKDLCQPRFKSLEVDVIESFFGRQSVFIVGVRAPSDGEVKELFTRVQISRTQRSPDVGGVQFNL